jgi:hypothetical protein
MASRKRKTSGKSRVRVAHRGRQITGSAVGNFGVRTAAHEEEGCNGKCSGLGISYEIVEPEDCEDALPSREVVNYAKKRAKEFSDQICAARGSGCFCDGTYQRIAVGSARVKEGGKDACLVYAIYFYSGTCNDVI